MIFINYCLQPLALKLLTFMTALPSFILLLFKCTETFKVQMINS